MFDKKANRVEILKTLIIKVTSRALALVIGIMIARLLKPEEFGMYSLALSVIGLATLPGVAGFPQLIIRELARYRSVNEYRFILGLLQWSRRYILLTSSLMLVLLFLSTSMGYWSDKVSNLIMIGVCLIPIKAMLSHQVSIYNGFEFFILGQLPDSIIRPLIVLTIVLFSIVISVELDSKILIITQLIASLVALLVSGYLLRKMIYSSHNFSHEMAFDITRWRRAMKPFAMLMYLAAISGELKIIAIGFFSDDAEIAYFKVASQAIALIALGLNSVNTVTQPQVARLIKKKDIDATQKLLSYSVRLNVTFAVPICILLIFYGDYFLLLLFGRDYLPADKLISILCIGQIVNTCMGSVGLVLNMSGHESINFRIQFVTFTIATVLLLILTPLYGAVGSAVSTVFGLTIWNITAAYYSYRLTGLKPWLSLSR